MSVRIIISLICDGCGLEITPAPEHRTTHAMSPMRDAKILARRDGWTAVSRGRYLPKAHYCKPCSDKSMKTVPKINRPRLVLQRGDSFDPDF